MADRFGVLYLLCLKFANQPLGVSGMFAKRFNKIICSSPMVGCLMLWICYNNFGQYLMNVLLNSIQLSIHNRKFMKKLFLIASLTILILGCASNKTEITTARSTVIPKPIRYVTPVDVKGNAENVIKLKNPQPRYLVLTQGKTTRQEMFDMLGRPSDIFIDKDTEYFSYDIGKLDQFRQVIYLKVESSKGLVYEYVIRRDGDQSNINIQVEDNVVQSIHIF